MNGGVVGEEEIYRVDYSFWSMAVQVTREQVIATPERGVRRALLSRTHWEITPTSCACGPLPSRPSGPWPNQRVAFVFLSVSVYFW